MIDTKCGTTVSLETNLSFVCCFLDVLVLKVHLPNFRNYTVVFKNNFSFYAFCLQMLPRNLPAPKFVEEMFKLLKKKSSEW